MELSEQFGRNLAALRREAGLTQDRLAAETSMGRNTLTRLEQGHSLPRLDQMVTLAQAIDVQIRDLLHGIE